MHEVLDYEQSLCLGIVEENDSASEGEKDARHVLTRQAIPRSLAWSFSSTIPKRKERLLVV